jgi:phosphate transport system substrate-binding protein
MNATATKLGLIVGLSALTTSGPVLSNLFAQAQIRRQQEIIIDGSSTVFPLTDEVAKEFQTSETSKAQIQIKVGISGTGGGFRKFCRGETDINNASRPILTEEMKACKAANVKYVELPVAYDALTVVVNPKNNWAKDITIAELKKLWEPAAQGKITRWNQVRASWPDQPINLYGAGKDSGTFDYFTQAVVGKAKASRNDYRASEDDTVIVEGVEKDPNALGYFGYSYYEENQEELKPLAIDSGKGAVLPSRETVRNAEYQPLSRPLFIYVNARSAQTKPDVRDFVDFYLSNARQYGKTVGYIPLPDEIYKIASTHFQNRKIGTVFAGQTHVNLKIEDLLHREAKF